jgi:hypothetical protein
MPVGEIAAALSQFGAKLSMIAPTKKVVKKETIPCAVR